MAKGNSKYLNVVHSSMQEDAAKRTGALYCVLLIKSQMENYLASEYVEEPFFFYDRDDWAQSLLHDAANISRRQSSIWELA